MLDRPLREFYINTSHNSYLPMFQNISVATKDAVRQTLLKGARCIELDIFSNSKNVPVIAHGTQSGILTTTSINFKDTLELINKHAFETTSDPLIICMELNTKNDDIVTDIIDVFGERLLGANYKLSSNNRLHFIDQPFHMLQNKVILVCGSGYTPLMRGVFDGSFTEYNLENMSTIDVFVNPDSFKRLYQAGSISSNFSRNIDPTKYWDIGVNCVSMNFQTLDSYMDVNNGMFKYNNFVHVTEYLRMQ